MATEKQRRRRAKEKRHAYDLVEIDAEGNETVVSASDVRSEESRPAKGAKQRAPRRQRGVPQPPSWERSFRRAGLFAAIFFAVILLLGNPIALAVYNAVLMAIVFVPFTYFLDRFMWRQYVKRNPGAVKP
jgi:Flp pilus assembly protein TadB